MKAFKLWFYRRISLYFAAAAVVMGVIVAANAADQPDYVSSADPVAVGVGAAIIVFTALMACRFVALLIRVGLYLSLLGPTHVVDARRIAEGYRNRGGSGHK